MTLSLNTIISYAQKGKDIYLPRTTLLLETQRVQRKPANQSGRDLVNIVAIQCDEELDQLLITE